MEAVSVDVGGLNEAAAANGRFSMVVEMNLDEPLTGRFPSENSVIISSKSLSVGFLNLDLSGYCLEI